MSSSNQSNGVKMKKVALAVAVVLGLVVVQPVQASDNKVLVIIDTAIDSTKVPVLHEVCFTAKTCPNGTSFQEGPGAANVSNWSVRGIDHGHNIAQAAINSAPDVKIIFIRISDLNVFKTSSSMHTAGASMANAIRWVSENSEKYGIDAVSISQSRINFAVGTCPTDVVFSSAVQVLKAKNILTYAATGNDARTNQVGFPSCVADVVGVGATKPSGGLASYTNSGPGMDITFIGNYNVKSYKGADITITGTSVAAPMAAAKSVSLK
jgi:hypothetical protein